VFRSVWMPQTVVPDDSDASSTPSSSPSQGGEPPGAAPDTTEAGFGAELSSP